MLDQINQSICLKVTKCYLSLYRRYTCKKTYVTFLGGLKLMRGKKGKVGKGKKGGKKKKVVEVEKKSEESEEEGDSEEKHGNKGENEEVNFKVMEVQKKRYKFEELFL